MRYLVLGLLMVTFVAPLRAQDVGYPVTIVELDERVATPLASAYSTSTERLWCVTVWETRDALDGHAHPYTLVHVTQVHEDSMATTAAHGVSLDRNAIVCRDPQGRALPTLHSHPGGACQASPDDTEAMLVRMSPFDGVLCGPRSHAWYFSPQLLDVLRAAQTRALARLGSG